MAILHLAPRHVPALALTLILGATSAPAVVPHQVDDFQDGTTQGWSSGGLNPVPPLNIMDAGPLGAGDHALQIRATGAGGAGSRLLAFNSLQWTGDYPGANIVGLNVDVMNPNAFDLMVRLAISGGGGNFASTDGVTVGVAAGWQNITLSLTPSDLTAVGGAGDVDATLGSVTTLRLLHNTAPSFSGLQVEGSMFVDNITAVPEPSMMGLGSLAIAASLGAFLKTRRKNAE